MSNKSVCISGPCGKAYDGMRLAEHAVRVVPDRMDGFHSRGPRGDWEQESRQKAGRAMGPAKALRVFSLAVVMAMPAWSVAAEPGIGAADAAQPAGVKLFDLPLIDQDGRAVKFASGAVGEHIVAINFVYTTCTTLCPLTSATFKRVQSQLKGRLGKEVWLISVTLDPDTDTPARLKEYAARYQAGPGWLWLTGERGNVRQILDGLGAYTADIRAHPPQVLVGDGRSGHWTRFNSLPGPDRIRGAVEQYLKSRHDG